MKKNEPELKFEKGDLRDSLTHYIRANVLDFNPISKERKELLDEMAGHILEKVRDNQPVNLIFICSQNSRRSHMSQLWAQVAASYYEIPHIHCYSGGTGATAFNPRAVRALQRSGFRIDMSTDGPNPVCKVVYAEGVEPVEAFSKKFSDPFNPQKKFSAVMTCSEADEACPIVPGAEVRFSIPYEDPKVADYTPEEETKYDKQCMQIANEMFYVFSKIKR